MKLIPRPPSNKRGSQRATAVMSFEASGSRGGDHDIRTFKGYLLDARPLRTVRIKPKAHRNRDNER